MTWKKRLDKKGPTGLSRAHLGQTSAKERKEAKQAEHSTATSITNDLKEKR
jgi:hypothetical protein